MPLRPIDNPPEHIIHAMTEKWMVTFWGLTYGAIAQRQLYFVAILGTPDEISDHIVAQCYCEGLGGKRIALSR